MSSTGSYSSGGMPKNPTFSTLKISAGGTFDLYNTADQTTNYERLRADWSGNIARFYVQSSGTGIDRDFRVGTSTLYHQYQQRTGTSPFVSFINAASASTNATGLNQLYSGSVFAASGTQIPVSIAPTINQSGTAGYTAFDINPTETAIGSGTKLLQRWAVGGTAQALISNTGATWALSFNSIAGFGFTTSVGGSTDVVLARDAADTLALRRSTNAQTFRVYNTYTDASNYERALVGWSGNIFLCMTDSAGTGTARSMAIGTIGTTSLAFLTANTSRWQVSSGGHFVATADNTYDIGASGANRPRNIFTAGVVSAGTYLGVAATRTVAALGAAAGLAYSRAVVSDSTVAMAGNYGAIVAGGGANIVPVFSDGTNWRIG